MLNSQRFLILSLLLALILTGCGFHLRDAMTYAKLAKPLQNLYLQARDPYSELARNIRQNLRLMGIHLATTPEVASTILNLSRETAAQELLSINSSQQTRQYNLKLSVTFEISDNKGKTLIPSQTITEIRPLTLQSNQILAGSNQATQLYQDMRRAIAYSLMNRLTSKAITQELLSAEKKS